MALEIHRLSETQYITNKPGLPQCIEMGKKLGLSQASWFYKPSRVFLFLKQIGNYTNILLLYSTLLLIRNQK